LTPFYATVGKVGNDFHGREIGETKKKKRPEKLLCIYSKRYIYIKMVWIHNTFSAHFFFLKNPIWFNGKCFPTFPTFLFCG